VEVAKHLLSRVTLPRVGLLGHRGPGEASGFAKQFFFQLRLIRQRERVRTLVVAETGLERGDPEESLGPAG
jgi:hypothetical protein